MIEDWCYEPAITLFIYNILLHHDMVELEPEDYTEILDWFIQSYGRWDFETDGEKLPNQTKKTYWKLHFLAEDKIKEVKEARG